MEKLADVITLFREFKNDSEKQAFLESQFKTIIKLQEKNKDLEQKIEHLEILLKTPKVETILITPEQALIEGQIDIIQKRSLNSELTLEDIKKLDLLIKNKALISKNVPETIDAKARKLGFSNTKLLEIAKNDS